MPRSKPGALPLGDAPNIIIITGEVGRGGWIRTNGCRDQNPVPYHLATPLMRQNFNIFAMQCQDESTKSIAIKSVFKIREWQGRLDSNQRMPRSKPGALPLGDAPNV